MIALPRFIGELLDKLDHFGFRSYVVGGSTRDLILGKMPKDWDICTPATPQEIKAIFPNHYAMGEKYGTIGVKTTEGIVQITTFRAESNYQDFRHPKVEFIKSLEEDLKRRDFSINAIAYHPQEGMIDLHQGIKDLQAKILSCIGEPQKRFEEDALRIMRLVRFGAVLGFSIENKSLQSALQNTHLLKEIAQERIRDELILTLQGKYFFQNFDLYFPILKQVLPSLHKPPLYTPHNLSLIFALLLQDISDLITLKVEKKIIERVKVLLDYKHTPIQESKIEIKKLLRLIGYDHFLALLELQKLLGKNTKIPYKLTQEIMIANECFTLKDLKINGSMLQKSGASGKKIGNTLLILLNEVIEEKLSNEQEALLKRAKELI